MSTLQPTRRAFLADSSRAVTAGWLSLHLPWVTALAACAREDARQEKPFVELTPAEGRAMRAFAARIIPSDDGTPGAEEAGAVYFVDRALGMPFFASSVRVVRAGLASLDERARAVDWRRRFASLSVEQQIAIIRQIEHEPFFAAARSLVVIGTFADPAYGGNKGGAGWKLVGIDHRPSYSAPYGWYDDPLGGGPPKRAA
jgi:gluconate 2-dehydrogenase gamma chain